MLFGLAITFSSSVLLHEQRAREEREYRHIRADHQHHQVRDFSAHTDL